VGILRKSPFVLLIFQAVGLLWATMEIYTSQLSIPIPGLMDGFGRLLLKSQSCLAILGFLFRHFFKKNYPLKIYR